MKNIDVRHFQKCSKNENIGLNNFQNNSISYVFDLHFTFIFRLPTLTVDGVTVKAKPYGHNKPKLRKKLYVGYDFSGKQFNKHQDLNVFTKCLSQQCLFHINFSKSFQIKLHIGLHKKFNPFLLDDIKHILCHPKRQF